MKNILCIAAAFILTSFLWGCGSAGGTGVSNPPTITNDNAVFYNAVQEVTPTFEVQGSSPSVTRAVVDTWETGNPLYEVFSILREFNPETDQGVIDTSNLYKTMFEGRNFFANTKTGCLGITLQNITGPFDFGNEPTTYNCAFNEDAENGYDFGGVMKEMDVNGNIIEITATSRTDETAAVKYGLFGFVWPGTHNEYGTLEGVYDSRTSDLSLDIAVWVDYTDQNNCYRNDIDGNTETHAFQFRSIKGNKVEGASFTSIVGNGYSQGEGKYFLLKIVTESITGKYYCIAAGSGESDLMAMDAGGSDTVAEACAEFQEDLDAMVPFTTDNLACQSSDFNPGGTGAAAEGTIFLNFQ